MEVQLGQLTACEGGNHLTLPVTIGKVTRELHFTVQDIMAQKDSDISSAEEDAVLVALALAEVKPYLLKAVHTETIKTVEQGTKIDWTHIRDAVNGKTLSM